MATISFEVKYYFNSNGLEWAEIPEPVLENIIQNCFKGLTLNFKEPIFPTGAEINEVDNYSELPKKMKKNGCDSFAQVYLSYEVPDSVIEELDLDELDESESFTGGIDKILGRGVFQIAPELLVETPDEVFFE